MVARISKDERHRAYVDALFKVADEFIALGDGDNQLLINDLICILNVQ